MKVRICKITRKYEHITEYIQSINEKPAAAQRVFFMG